MRKRLREPLSLAAVNSPSLCVVAGSLSRSTNSRGAERSRGRLPSVDNITCFPFRHDGSAR